MPDRHFPVQSAARATYREILERRAKENGVDFTNGVATAITPMAFFEAVMVRAWEALVDQDAAVDANTGMAAASKLQAVTESRAGEMSMAEVMVRMDRVIRAVRTSVPPELWPEIRRQLRPTTSPPSRSRKRTATASSRAKSRRA